MKTALTLLLSLLLAVPAAAEQVLESGIWRLHYIAMVSTELTPDVARAYGITRSRKRGVLVLNLQRSDAPLVSQPAQVTGRIRNLIGQERLGELREVTEQEARYWIADFGFSHLETMRFDFSVLPHGESVPLTLKFSQQFYTPPR